MDEITGATVHFPTIAGARRVSVHDAPVPHIRLDLYADTWAVLLDADDLRALAAALEGGNHDRATVPPVPSSGAISDSTRG